MTTPGSIIAGRYRVERTLGEGGMGVVVAATQLSLGRLVALKLMKASTDAGAVERFQREVDVIARLQHPNIVAVIDGGVDRGVDAHALFLAMELLQGESLRARMRKGPLPWAEACALAADVASGLAAAHDVGVIHRDVKPENVMLVPAVGHRERAKVVDFGIAKVVRASSITSPAVVPGTPGCISPEQLQGVDDEPRSDLYALGVMLFEMIAGAPPFTAATSAALIVKHMTEPAPRLADVCARRRIDVPPDVDALVHRLLDKDPARRPTAVELVRELNALDTRDGASADTSTAQVTLPPVRAAVPTPTTDAPRDDGLVGRDAELAVLQAALADAVAGRGALVFLTGEPGIGKTRLADALALRAQRDGDVAWGRAWEAGGAPAFWPWSEALGSVAAVRDIELPETLANAFGGATAHAGVDPTDTSFRVFQAVDALLDKACRARPLVLILDDLHAADLASLQLLQAVARRLRGKRLLVVGTFRDVEAAAVPEVAKLLGTIAREGKTVHVAPLSARDVGTLLRKRGEGVDEDVTRAIVDAAHGNPLFITELAELLRAQGRLEKASTGPLPIPLGVKEAIRQRLDRLDAETLAVIGIAAVAGRRVDPRVIGIVAGRAIDDELARAVRGGILVNDPSDDPSRPLQFHHVLVVDVLVRELASSERQRLHGAVADAAASLGAPPSEVAHHLFEAGPERANDAVDTALDDAERSRARGAFADAAVILERALVVLDSVRAVRASAIDADDERRRARVLVALGRARLLKDGETGARAMFVDAAAIARRLADHELLAEAALGYGARIRDSEVLPDLVSLLEEALAVVSETSLLRCRVMARLAAARQPAANPLEPIALAQEAFALARATGDKQTILGALHDGMGALVDMAPPQDREPVNREVLRLAEELGDLPRARRTRRRLLWDQAELDPLGLEPVIAAYEADLEPGEPRVRITMCRAILAAARGDYGAAVQHFAELSPARSGWSEVSIMPGSIAYAYERSDDLRSCVAALRGSLPPSLNWRFFYDAHLELWDTFLEERELVAARLLGAGPYLDRNIDFLVAVAAIARRDVELCRVIAQNHERDAATIQVFTGCAPVGVILAECWDVAGDRARAASLFEDALALAQRVRIPLGIVRASLAFAAHLLDANVSENRARAGRMLDDAAPIIERLQLVRSQRTLETLRARLN